MSEQLNYDEIIFIIYTLEISKMKGFIIKTEENTLEVEYPNYQGGLVIKLKNYSDLIEFCYNVLLWK